MILTPGNIKAITTEIASQIVAELRWLAKPAYFTIKSARVCDSISNNKDTFIDYSKYHKRRTRKQVKMKV